MSARALCWLLAALAAGCTVESLDRTGRIRASSESDAGCPRNYVVRWGRCCPPDTTSAQCPAEVGVDPTGTEFAPENCACPAGSERRGDACCAAGALADAGACTGANRLPMVGCVCPAGYEVRFNRCCPLGAGPECPAGEIGSPCLVNEDCRLPIGAARGLAPYCLRPEDPSFNVAANPFFSPPFRVPATGYCSVARCAAHADCGPGARCTADVQSPSNPDAGTRDGGAGGVASDSTFCFRACDPPNGGPGATCPLTNNQYACHRWRVPLVMPTYFDFCLPDCRREAGLCQNGARCFPDLPYCVRPCATRVDDIMCGVYGYARCNVEAGHCEY